MKKKKLLVAAGGTVALLAVGLLALPLLLSSDWMRSFVLGKVNRSIPGEVAVEDCTIGWQQGAECSGVVYSDSKQGLRLDIAELRLNRGLWPLLTAPEDLGELVIDRPELLLTVKPAKPEQPAETADSSAAEQKAGPDKGQSAETATAPQENNNFLSKMKVRLTVREAAVSVAQEGKTPQLFLGNGALRADMQAGQVDFKLTAADGQQGRAEITGTAKLTELMHGGFAGAAGESAVAPDHCVITGTV